MKQTAPAAARCPAGWPGKRAAGGECVSVRLPLDESLARIWARDAHNRGRQMDYQDFRRNSDSAG